MRCMVAGGSSGGGDGGGEWRSATCGRHDGGE